MSVKCCSRPDSLPISARPSWLVGLAPARPPSRRTRRGAANRHGTRLTGCSRSAGSLPGLRLQPRHFDIDRELDAMLAQPPGERLLARSCLVLTIASLGSPVVVVGAAALVAHGVPVQVQALDLAVGTTPAEVDGAVRLLQKVFARYTPTDFEDPLPGWVVPETVTLPGRRRAADTARAGGAVARTPLRGAGPGGRRTDGRGNRVGCGAARRRAACRRRGPGAARPRPAGRPVTTERAGSSPTPRWADSPGAR